MDACHESDRESPKRIAMDALLVLDCACKGHEGKGRVCCLHHGLAAVEAMAARQVELEAMVAERDLIIEGLRRKAAGAL